jgi:hypothetical protein
MRKNEWVWVSVAFLFTGMKLNIPQTQKMYSTTKCIIPCLKGCLLFTIIQKSATYRVFQKEIYNGISTVTVWRVLWKRLHLKAYKIFSVYAFKCKRFRNTRHTVTFVIPLCSSFLNTLHYQWRSRWTVTIQGENRCALLHYDSPKHCTCPLNKFMNAFKVAKLVLKDLLFQVKRFGRFIYNLALLFTVAPYCKPSLIKGECLWFWNQTTPVFHDKF